PPALPPPPRPHHPHPPRVPPPPPRGAADFFIPADALREARLDKALAGKVLPEGGLLIITWAHGETLIDSGFRSDHAAEHQAWVDAVSRLTGAPATTELTSTTTEGTAR
ncbi:hypothetical protein ACFWIP_36410, partial [Streptomyces anulatus]